MGMRGQLGTAWHSATGGTRPETAYLSLGIVQGALVCPEDVGLQGFGDALQKNSASFHPVELLLGHGVPPGICRDIAWLSAPHYGRAGSQTLSESQLTFRAKHVRVTIADILPAETPVGR